MAVVVDNTLDLVREKVEAGERLDFDDGLALLESDDLLALGELADLARRLRGGDRSETVAALRTIVPTLLARGYRLVTVPQLLGLRPAYAYRR